MLILVSTHSVIRTRSCNWTFVQIRWSYRRSLDIHVWKSTDSTPTTQMSSASKPTKTCQRYANPIQHLHTLLLAHYGQVFGQNPDIRPFISQKGTPKFLREFQVRLLVAPPCSTISQRNQRRAAAPKRVEVLGRQRCYSKCYFRHWILCGKSGRTQSDCQRKQKSKYHDCLL